MLDAERLAGLLWLVNLGCIDLNPWYARYDDVDRPDYLRFDLDPVPEAAYAAVVETAQLVGTALRGLGMAPIVKTTGSRGLHVYMAIVRGPTQKEVWGFAKKLPARIAAVGDLWAPLLATSGRFDLAPLIGAIR